MIPPLMSYYGSKWRLAPKYPPPRYGTIIEPFAGAAGYSCRYHDRDVVLVEKNHKIAEVLKYLVRATPEEIMALPLLEPGQCVNDFDLTDAKRWLVGAWIGSANFNPRRFPATWLTRTWPDVPPQYWGARCRARLAGTVSKIRHWRVIEGDYSDAPDVEATWFIDPPYAVKGAVYPCGSADIDYAELAGWCRSRRGQVIVCENDGATWLPFVPFCEQYGASKDGGTRRRSVEAVWMNDGLRPGEGLPEVARECWPARPSPD